MTDNQQPSRTCPECGITFSCSANRQCWCMDMPALLPLDSSSNSGACYCQRCLSKRVAAQLERLIASKPHTEVLAKAALYRTQSSAKQGLLEYIDYHPKSEQLTAWYHLKRGYCCDNNCQHCPYPVDQD